MVYFYASTRRVPKIWFSGNFGKARSVTEEGDVEMGEVLGVVITLLLLVPISIVTAKTIFAFLRQVIRYDTTGKWSIFTLNFCGIPLFYLSMQDELFILACENHKFAVLKWFAERDPVKSYATYINAWNSRKASSAEYPQVDDVDDVFILIDTQYKKAQPLRSQLNDFGSNHTYLSLAARDGDLPFVTRLIFHYGKEQNEVKDRAMLMACSCSCATRYSHSHTHLLTHSLTHLLTHLVSVESLVNTARLQIYCWTMELAQSQVV
jgi:hypothetical protein